MHALPDFALKRFFNQPAAATARANLSPSFAEPLGTAALLALEPGAAEQFVALPLGYTTAFGGAALRAAIAARYKRIAPEQILAACGGDDILPSLFMALLEPGDHLIVHSPVYQPLAGVATWCGAAISFWAADEDAGWSPSLAELRALIRPTTRLIVTNFPHSPTGFVPDRGYLEQLIALADEAGGDAGGGRDLPGFAARQWRGGTKPGGSVRAGGRAEQRLEDIRAAGVAGRLAGDPRRDDPGNGARLPHVPEQLYRRADGVFGRPRPAPRRYGPRPQSRLGARKSGGSGGIHGAQRGPFLLGTAARRGRRLPPRWLGPGTTTALSERLLRDHGLLLAPSAYFAGGERHVRVGFGTAGAAIGLELLEEALRA